MHVRRWFAYCMTPVTVSYTHLDVYKRQDGNGIAGFIREFREENARVTQRRGK